MFGELRWHTFGNSVYECTAPSDQVHTSLRWSLHFEFHAESDTVTISVVNRCDTATTSGQISGCVVRFASHRCNFLELSCSLQLDSKAALCKTTSVSVIQSTLKLFQKHNIIIIGPTFFFISLFKSNGTIEIFCFRILPKPKFNLLICVFIGMCIVYNVTQGNSLQSFVGI